MGNPLGFRLRDEDQEEFLEIVDQEGMSVSSLTSKIVHDWLRFRRSKQTRGDITLASKILRSRHEAIQKKMIPKIVKGDSKYILSEMQFQVDNLDFKELTKRITEWNKENGLLFVMRNREGSKVFMQKHDLGIVWSEIQCKMYCMMYESIGETILSKKFEKNSFSFEIVSH
jgi:hypothetical protein